MRKGAKRLNQEQIEKALVKVGEVYTALCSIGDLICENTRETSTIHKRYCSLRLKTWKLENVLQDERATRRRLDRELV